MNLRLISSDTETVLHEGNQHHRQSQTPGSGLRVSSPANFCLEDGPTLPSDEHLWSSSQQNVCYYIVRDTKTLDLNLLQALQCIKALLTFDSCVLDINTVVESLISVPEIKL